MLYLYNIGIEEVIGSREGKPYRGLLNTVLDDKGQKAEASPLKSSLFGKDYGYDAIEQHTERSGEKIGKDNTREQVRHRVAEAFLDAPTESALRERLRAYRIDLFIRRNDTGRIVGVTFIDHENRCVLNGSRLGKEYAANALNERYLNLHKAGAELHEADITSQQKMAPKRKTIRKNKKPNQKFDLN